ncbi:MAG: hypothetical protein LM590_09015 [Thermofilum sp.]|nr:hypothetical protein [Thermofilum sp.]
MLKHPPKKDIYAIYIRFCLSECNLQEILRKLEGIVWLDELQVHFKRLLVFSTCKFDLLLERLYTTSCTEDLYLVIDELDLEHFLTSEDMQHRVSSIIASLLLGRSSFNIDFLDLGRKLTPETKRELREELIKKVKQLLGSRELRVSRSSPSIDFKLILLEPGKVLLSVVLKKFRKDRFQYRWTEKRPYSQPSSLTPYHALVLFNVSFDSSPDISSSLEYSKVLLDPFLGTGSILIEAALQGVYGVGIDLSYRQIRGAKRNLNQLDLLPLVDLVISDSTHLPLRKDSLAAVAFDPPYGRLASTYKRTPSLLLRTSLESVKITLKKPGKAVFLAVDGNKPRNSAASKICDILEHGSLIRHLYVMENA